MSLRARLALIFALVAVAGVAAASGLSYVSTRGELDNEVNRFLERRANEIVQGTRATPNRGAPGNGPPIAVEADAVVQILDARGSPASSTGVRLPVDTDEARIAVSGGQPVTREVTVDGVTYRMRTMALRREGLGAVQVARALTENEDVLAGLRTRLALAGLLVAVAAAGAGWLVARRTTSPLRQLASTAGHVAETGDLQTRVATERRDEVGQLSRSFDAMLGALATSREQQHRLVQDAGHELRTPLTALRTDVDLLRRAHDLEDVQRAAIVANIEEEVVELSELVGELIGLATDSHDDEPAEPLDLAEVVADAVARFERRTGRTVSVQASPSPVVGRRAQLDRAVTNLLGNAHKFSPPDAPISAVVEDGAVLVRDGGPGIAPEDRERVFDRFFRGETARAAAGSGLGLAIVEQIARRHGGTVQVGDAPEGGAEVGFRLPIATPTT
jgi:two-component system sensor histidine kinase MprB